MSIDAWVGAGLYDPESPGADERRALLEFLTDRGATVEQMVDAHALGSLPAVAGELALGRQPETLSVAEVAARCGVSVERAERVLLAVGLPTAGDSRLPSNLSALFDSFEQGASLMGEDAIVAFTRVLGAAATSIAEAATSLFYAELGPGTPREGSTEVERARISETATLAFGTVPDVLHQVLMAQFARAGRRAALARGWSATSEAADDEAGLGRREVVALGFVDLVGSTAWAEGLSLRDHSLALSRFESASWSAAVQAGGRVIKMIGDEVFFAAPSVDAACRIGTEVCRSAGSDPLLPPARAAVGHGSVTSREGDYFGPLVNLVSRLVKVAEPGALVITAEAAATLPPDRWTLRELDRAPLRGLEHPTRVFAVTIPDPPTN